MRNVKPALIRAETLSAPRLAPLCGKNDDSIGPQGNHPIHIQFIDALSPPAPLTGFIRCCLYRVSTLLPCRQDSNEEQIGAWQSVRCPKYLKAPHRRDPRLA
jgi:hypothetical protein